MYRERTSRVPGARVWSSTPAPGPAAGSGGLVLPDGCLDLLWRCEGGEGRLLVAGPDTRAHRADGDGRVRWTGLRFAPGHAPALLGVPAHELRDARVPLEDLWSADRVRRLTSAVALADRPGTALEEIAGAAPPPDALTARAARLLADGRRVADVAEDLGVGLRWLHRRSLAAFGYSPQVLARVLRLQRAVRALRAGRSPAEVAAGAGFSDQAHLAREVRAFTGRTPRAFQPSAANRSTDAPSGSRTTA